MKCLSFSFFKKCFLLLSKNVLCTHLLWYLYFQKLHFFLFSTTTSCMNIISLTKDNVNDDNHTRMRIKIFSFIEAKRFNCVCHVVWFFFCCKCVSSLNVSLLCEIRQIYSNIHDYYTLFHCCETFTHVTHIHKTFFFLSWEKFAKIYSHERKEEN